MDSIYDIEQYDYVLPQECIAQEPTFERDQSRLLVMDCTNDSIEDKGFGDILELLKPGDLLITNDTKVFPARLLGKKTSGGKVELLVLEYPNESASKDGAWSQIMVTGLVKSSKRPRHGGRLIFSENLEGVVDELLPGGKVRVLLKFKGDLDHLFGKHGIMPLPPYIQRESGGKPEDRQRYQTVFAKNTGAIAAPTAGLHFTDNLLAKIREKEVNIASVTLHVGYGTFAPVRVDDIREHQIHAEYLEVSEETASLVNKTREAGGTIWAVGTTTVRALEFAADEHGQVHKRSGLCNLYIFPGYKFKVVKNLITNFHLPKSSLLFMISALAGRERLMRAYNHAIKKGYRFYSYGDAMAIIAS